MSRLWLSIIGWTTPAADRESVVGDTLEELDHLERTQGPAAARRWLRREASLALSHAARRHLTAWPRRTAATGRRPTSGLGQELRHAARQLVRAPGHSLAAVTTLALGIGATTAVFTVVHGVLLEPLPYDQPDRLVRLTMRVSSADGSPSRRVPVSLDGAQRRQLLAGAESLTHGAAAAEVFANWVGREPRFHGARVTSSIFRMLGPHPLLGRVLGEADEDSGAPGAILLGERTWRRYFSADEDALGRTITLEAALGDPAARPYTIVGVLPEEFAFPSREAQFWTPFPSSGPGATASGWGPFIGRMADGVSLEAAASEIVPLVRELRETADGPAASYELAGELEDLVSPVRDALTSLGGAALCLLLIACANVANLMVARGVRRRREIAIRSVLGASRARIIRLALAESVLLAGLGGGAGLLLAAVGVRLFRVLAATDHRFDLGALGTHSFPRLETLAVDGSALLFTLALSVGVAVVFGLASSLREPPRALVEVLQRGDGPGSWSLGSGRRLRAGNALTVVEVALVLVLLVSGALLTSSFVRMSRVDGGYDARNVVTFQVSLPTEHYTEPREREFAEGLVARLAMTPGVLAAGYANQLPLVALKETARLYRTPDPAREPGRGGADARLVSRDYLRAMGVEVLAGRGLREGDAAGAPRVMLVNEALARDALFGADPLEQLVYVGASPEAWRVVGVVRDVRQFGPQRPTEPQFFVDARQWGGEPGPPLFPIGAYYALRLGAGARAILPNLERTVRAMEPRAVVFNAAPMEDIVTRSVSRPRLNAALVAVVALLSLLLALAGIHSAVICSVSQRTREIGIRVAIGAQRNEVMKLVLGESLRLTLTGIGIGIGLALVTTRYLEHLLFGITPVDPPTYLGAALSFAVVGALAAYFPARRAMSIEPVLALRGD
jgi:putative ABC transport system permease protein